MHDEFGSPGARVAHVGLAVRSAEPLRSFLRNVLGLAEVELGNSDGAKITGLAAGSILIELLEPDQPDTPIERFIKKRGPGIHHISFKVENLDATLEKCVAAGIRLIDATPRVGAEGCRIAFLHPDSTGGILIELSE